MQTLLASDRRLDRKAFLNWCERQADQSRSRTARIIRADDEAVRFRIREETERGPEDIILVKGKEVDIIRFERGETSQQFHLHRRDVKICDKTLIVQDGEYEICRAGTGTKNKRGPFPI